MSQIQPGWYPDPESHDSVRWHDGSTWTTHTADRVARPAYTGRPALGSGWPVLARVLQIALAVDVAVALAWAVQSHRMHSFLADVRTGSSSADVTRANSLDRVTLLIGTISLGMIVVTGVLFIVWLYRAHRSSAMNAGFLHHASGWAIGGWFVPVLFLWRPFQMVQDVHRGASEDHTDSILVIVWWTSFLTSGLADRIASWTTPADTLPAQEILRQLSGVATRQMVASSIDALAAVVAILLVRHVTAVVLAARDRQ